MKKLLFFCVIISAAVSVYAFDRSLNGSWGIVQSCEKMEFLRFNTTEIVIMNTLFRAGDFEEADDTIAIELDGESVLIQYYRLSQSKLLFVMWNTDSPEESITLILSRL